MNDLFSRVKRKLDPINWWSVRTTAAALYTAVQFHSRHVGCRSTGCSCNPHSSEVDHHSHRADSYAGLSLKLLERSEHKHSLLWDSAEHSSGSEHQPGIIWDKDLNMEYTWLLLLLLLNLSGAFSAAVQWTELEEAKVR